MAEFRINQDVATDAPTVEVSVTPATPLAPGRHSFRLVVTDDSGNNSQPDEVVVIVADTSAPTAVLTAPRVVDAGKSFVLDGSRSFDVGGGKVVRYVWTYLGQP